MHIYYKYYSKNPINFVNFHINRIFFCFAGIFDNFFCIFDYL